MNKVNLTNMLVKVEDGTELNLSDLKTRYLVLYFYPKDSTPGCTVEACEFRDSNLDIQKLGATILGVSKDSIKSHTKFSENHSLNFQLVSDTDLVLHKIFGAWVEKSMYGKKYMGTNRCTFVVDLHTGEILHSWNKVKPAGHALEIKEFLQTL